MLSEETELNPYDPNRKRFIILTLCRVIAQAKSWDEVVSGCEALANSMRIVTEADDEALRDHAQVAAALRHLLRNWAVRSGKITGRVTAPRAPDCIRGRA